MHKRPEPSDYGISEFPVEKPNTEILPLTVILMALGLGGSSVSFVMLLKTLENDWLIGVFGSVIVAGMLLSFFEKGGLSLKRREHIRLFEADQRSRAKYENAVRAWEVEREERQLQYWRSLKAERLEVGFAALIRRKGWDVETTPKSGDNGIDLVCARGDSIVLVQCKGHSKSIGVGVIRDALGVSFANEGRTVAVVGPIGFTKGSISLAKAHGVRLFDARDCVDIANGLREF